MGFRISDNYSDAGDLVKNLHIPSGATVLDAACGKGNLLYRLWLRFDCALYGMEVNPDNLKFGRKEFGADRILRGEPGLNTLVKSHSFSLIALPSYEEEEIHDHIKWARQKLVDGGILVALVASRNLNSFLKTTLWTFDLIKGMPGPRSHRIVCLKRKDRAAKPKKEELEKAVQIVQDNLLQYSLVQVPEAPEMNIEPFRSLVRSDEEILAMLKDSTLGTEALDAITRPRTARDEMPPIPLKQGHIALQLATGRFNGAVGKGDARHVVKGRVIRTPMEHEETDSEGNIVDITEDFLSVEVTALTSGGIVQRFSSQREE